MTKFRLLLLVMLVSLITLGVGLYHRQNITAAFGMTSANECEVAAAGACAKCGDGVCAKSCENARTCPRDCGGSGGTTSASAACGRCGDGVCVKKCGENAKSCPADCGGSPSVSSEPITDTTQ